jgi:D-lactate dehydrogenase
MKIAFFEIHDWEAEIIEKVFSGHQLFFSDKPLTLENVAQVKDYEVLSVFIYSKIDKTLLAKMPNLKYITTRSMGLDHINLKDCRKRGVDVSCAPHYGDNSVAEHAFGLILSISRNIHKAYVRTLNKNYSIEGLKGFDLKGKTIAVIGVGRIGSHVVKMANSFEMNILAVDRHPQKDLIKNCNCKYVSLADALKKSDIVTLHVPYCEANHHLMNEKTFKRMKRGAILINTSRGPVVDTKALLDALDSGQLSGAGLDVLEGEELIKEEKELLHDPTKFLNLKKMHQLAIDHELLNDEKVVFTPHIAFYSQEAVQRILDVTIDNIRAFLKKKPINVVN